MKRSILYFLIAMSVIFPALGVAQSDGSYVDEDGYTLQVVSVPHKINPSDVVIVPPESWGPIEQMIADEKAHPWPPASPCGADDHCAFCRRLQNFFAVNDGCEVATAQQIVPPGTDEEAKCNADIESYYSRRTGCDMVGK